MQWHNRQLFTTVWRALVVVLILVLMFGMWLWVPSRDRCCPAHAFWLQRLSERVAHITKQLETSTSRWDDQAGSVKDRLEALAAQTVRDRQWAMGRVKSLQEEIRQLQLQQKHDRGRFMRLICPGGRCVGSR